MSRVPRSVVEEIEERRGESCEATGWPWLRIELHHRRPYRMGGRATDPDGLQNTAANVIALCPRHHRWAHAQGPSEPHNLLLAENDDPRERAPVADPRLGRCSF